MKLQAYFVWCFLSHDSTHGEFEILALSVNLSQPNMSQVFCAAIVCQLLVCDCQSLGQQASQQLINKMRLGMAVVYSKFLKLGK
jgi:formate/nitrite transporter FocA (FNT family)